MRRSLLGRKKGVGYGTGGIGRGGGRWGELRRVMHNLLSMSNILAKDRSEIVGC